MKVLMMLVTMFLLVVSAGICDAKNSFQTSKALTKSNDSKVISSSSISIFQRSKVALENKTSRDFHLSIGDITGGQVMTSVFVYSDDKKHEVITLIPNQSFTPNTSKTFEYEGRLYRLKLKRLRNHLLGDDHAIFIFYHLKKVNKKAPNLV